MKRQKLFSLILLLFVTVLSAKSICAQTVELTKEQLVAKSNALYEGGDARAALDLIERYPQFANEVDVLYVKSVAYIQLRDFKNADEAFQKQFDVFRGNAAGAIADAEEIIAKNSPLNKENRSLALLMYGAAMISFGPAELVNSLRGVALEKAGISAAQREPKNLAGYDEMRKDYEETALKTAALSLEANELKQALANFNKAVELNPKNARAYEGRAKVYRRTKRISLAVADETKAKRLAAAK